ncbi:hypothetical protein RIF29_30662 [Crotalaria pallida]|uniref:Uncharacterized protein n=1 Tax=Crotalaria pallida TaxID=3830 RepID=A0AAN9HUT0_CROPI
MNHPNCVSCVSNIPHFLLFWFVYYYYIVLNGFAIQLLGNVHGLYIVVIEKNYYLKPTFMLKLDGDIMDKPPKSQIMKPLRS